ncbi:MAG: BMP family ABC transporter substrate-binding protein [Eubacteriales bacterium]
MKKFLYILLSVLALSHLLSACTTPDEPDASVSAMPSSSVTIQPTEIVVSASPVTFIFNDSEASTYLSLYHQLAYLKMQNAGYQINSIYVNESSDMQSVFSQMESEGVEYAVITSRSLWEQSKIYMQNNNSSITIMQYSDDIYSSITAYNIKLYEYYYLAGVALCNESTTKIAGFVADSPSEQTIQCINAFALGMKSIDVDSKVILKWLDQSADEGNAAQLVSDLSAQGCDVFAYYMDGDMVEKAANDVNSKYMTMSTHTFLNVDSNIAIKPNISLDKYYAEVMNNQNLNSFSYLGIQNSVVGYELSTTVTDETRSNMASAYSNIQNGYEVFSGPIYSKLGLIVPQGSSIPTEDILDMLWLVDSVDGDLPAG